MAEPRAVAFNLSLANAILALGEVTSNADESGLARAGHDLLPRLLEQAARLATELVGVAWSIVVARETRESREVETVLHVRRFGDAGASGDDEALLDVLSRADGIVAAASVGGASGAVWVVPFGFEPAGRGWLVVPVPEGAAHERHAPVELRAFAAHLGMSMGQVLLAQVVRSTRTMYRTLVEQLPAVTYYRSVDTPGAASFMSPQMETLTGYTAEEWAADPGLFVRRLHPEDRVWVLPDQALFSPQDATLPLRKEYRIIHRDGRTVWVENTALAVRDEAGRARFVMGLLFDITERKALEASLREAQKLEAVGKLAGGVAHDFNNMLSVILGWVADLKCETAMEDPRWQSLDEVEQAAERARVLTHKLLAFGRRQMLDLRSTHLDVLVAGLEATMQKLAGDAVTLDVRLSEVDAVKVDAGQIEQVLLNLVANARDAMPRGGRIEVAVYGAMRFIDGVERATVCVSVRDEGSGVDEVTRARIFEPFFTTKERTRNTGLGLSTALGIVQQCGGFIDVQSRPGLGSTFTVVLPVSLDFERDALAELRMPARAMRTTSPRTILVVEADAQMRRLLMMLLGRLGHRAWEASDATASLLRVATDGRPDLAILDLVGPREMGSELAWRLRASLPDLPLVLLSALTDASVVETASSLRAPILRKPFTMKALVAALDEALGSTKTKGR